MLKIKHYDHSSTATRQTKGAGRDQVSADFTYFCVYLILWVIKHNQTLREYSQNTAIS